MFEELNDRDRENLLFLLTAPPHIMDAWWLTVDTEDKEYAATLLQLAQQLLIDKAVDKYGTAQAQEVLAKYTAKNS